MPSINSINSVSLNLRDFLLHKNLGPVYPFSLNQVPSPKIGEPVLDTMVNNGANVIPNGLPLETNGILRKDIVILPNQFKNTSSTADDLTVIDYSQATTNMNYSRRFPDGSNYPTGPNDDVNNYGIVGKSNEAGFGNIVNQNILKDLSPTAGNTVTIDRIPNPGVFGLPLETEGILRMEIALLPNKYKDVSSTAGELVIIEDVQSTAKALSSNGTSSYGINSANLITNQQYRKTATIKNLYLDTSKQLDMADFISLQTGDVSQQINGYMDVYGGLNLGGSPAIQASSVIGSVLNGQGLGLAKGGLVTNFDLRSSLAGRILGATGIINDTRLGMIGGQQLALALANNAAFNVQQQVLGALNVQDNVLSLVKNGTLAGFRPNYQITVPSSTGGKVLDYTARILGFTLPKSYLEDAGSIFQSENNSAENIDRANSMLQHTGKGQLTALLKNIVANINGTGTGNDSPDKTAFRSGYAPGYQDHKGINQINGNQLYAFSKEGHFIDLLKSSDGVIPDLSYLRQGKVDKSGFKDTSGLGFPTQQSYSESNINNPGFSWGTSTGGLINSTPNVDEYIGDKKSLLSKTQKLFNSIGMKTIVSTKGYMDVTPNQLQTSVVGGGISKGNAVMKKESFTKDGFYDGSKKTADETYYRSWTTFDRYDKVKKLVRSSGLTKTVPYRLQTDGSILDEYGFPKIAPYSTDKPADPKKFMFSIENLAWNDNVHDLLLSEQGPGDLITGKKGRIMWFPPYNIQFSENTNVNWESNNFIGRGESVYTYSNTERSGTLSFQIVVDHPSYVNSFRGSKGPDDHYVASFFAGCIDPSIKFYEILTEKLTVSEQSSVASTNITKSQIKTVTPQLPPPSFEIYYPNDVDSIISDYESGKCGIVPIDYSTYVSGCGLGVFPGSFTSSGPWNDRYNFGLNGQKNIITIDGVQYSGFSDPSLIGAINTYLNTKCPACVVEVTGYASAQGNTTAANQKLADARADKIISVLKPQIFTSLSGIDKEKMFKKLPSKPLTGTGCVAKKGSDTDTIECKKDRKASVSFRFDSNLLPIGEVSAEPVIQVQQQNLSNKILNRFYDESSYFEQLTDIDTFVFDKFRDKIKYFHPAFHSTTPEGLNSRLTFLNQCTRQGPTLEVQGANNLAFGRPPVCILRIGDFYNTKIVIDNIGIDYEPLVWDLNPEGVGVQPMIANVSMTFKFIGGSTLLGPINKLQNALSFNYYANAQVYDVRADYISKDPDPNKQTGPKGEELPDHYINNSFNPSTYKNGIKTSSQAEINAGTPVRDQEAGNNIATSGNK